MRSIRLVFAFLACLAMATPGFAQGSPTGTISGRVSSDAGPLPGVTVTATSPALQGSRTAVSSENGDYILPLLPPGAYKVTFELQGFRTLEQTTNVAAAQTVPVSVSLTAGTTETVTVTGSSDNFARLAPVATSFKAEEIASLPTDRSLNSTVLFAPGVFATGPSTNSQDSSTQAITIAGAMSFENLFLVNGVVLNENLRGQAVPLFIEDAVQETTVTSGAVSAEFGRFSGGVVNAVTKSGGNRFSGSFRTTFTNDDWRELTPHPNDVKVDDVVPTYEFTGGGPIARDHLWFFGAGRVVDRVEGRQTTTTNVPYTFSEAERRYEGKLTFSPTANHTIRGSYIYRNRDQFNASSFTILDLRSLYDRSLPDDLRSVNYTGVLSPNFFIEGTYSNRNLKFVDSGATSTDIVDGTLVTDQARNSRYWSPTFCGVCGLDEERNNENFVVKGTYFASTRGTGSHSLVFGYDTFNDIRLAENHQSGSDYRILGTTSIIRDGVVYPSWAQTSTQVQWNPIDAASLGTAFRTHSLFVNDQWRLGDHVTLNLGVRWDKNSGKDSAGNPVADDAGFSPRLAVTFDPTGDASWTVNASYGKYIAGLANSVADSGSNGGVASTYQYAYLGPAINTDLTAPTSSLIPTDEALRTLWSLVQRQRRHDATGRRRRHSRRQQHHRRKPQVAERARSHRRRHPPDRQPRHGAGRRHLPGLDRLLLLTPRHRDRHRARSDRHRARPDGRRQQQRSRAAVRGDEPPVVVPARHAPDAAGDVHAVADLGQLRRRDGQQRPDHRRRRRRRQRHRRPHWLGRLPRSTTRRRGTGRSATSPPINAIAPVSGACGRCRSMSPSATSASASSSRSTPAARTSLPARSTRATTSPTTSVTRARRRRRRTSSPIVTASGPIRSTAPTSR